MNSQFEKLGGGYHFKKSNAAAITGGGGAIHNHTIAAIAI